MFRIQVTEHWYRFPKEVVESPPWRYSNDAGHGPGQPATIALA